MNTFQERIKPLKELPLCKSKYEELILRIESLNKIKEGISQDNFQSLLDNYSKQVNDLLPKIEKLKDNLSILNKDIELDSKMLESEISILEKEQLEVQFMFERGAINKMDYDKKRNSLQNKIINNKSLLRKNYSLKKELEFYETYVGLDSYLKNVYKDQVASIITSISNLTNRIKEYFSLKRIIFITVLILLVIVSIVFYKPIKDIIEEKITWNNTLKEDSYHAYDLYLLTYPNGKYIIEAEKKREDALWEITYSRRKINSIYKYISGYPSGVYINQAKQMLDSLVWDSISKEGTIKSYNYYIQKFPKGKNLEQAKMQITVIGKNNSLIDRRDGTTYKTVSIGNQIWMAENLNADRYLNGDPIPEAQTPNEWIIYGNKGDGAWCYYKNKSEYGEVYGKLYNWYAVTDKRGLAPDGWHIPYYSEWTILVQYLGGTEAAGGKLKEKGTRHWVRPNNDATNEVNFGALPSGGRSSISGDFSHIGVTCWWWCLANNVTNEACSWSIINYYGYLQGACNTDKKAGFSVRCIKDF